MVALCSGEYKLHSDTSSTMSCQLDIELHAFEWVCLVPLAIFFLQVDIRRILGSNAFASNSVSNREKLLRRFFRCCNRFVERIA